MRLVQKVLAGFFYTIGIPLFAIGLYFVLEPNASREDKEGGIAVLTLFAGPPLVAAGFLTWNLRRTTVLAEEKQEQQQEQVFLRLLKENQGIMTPLRLAAETGIPIAEAKSYLDQKAKELNATFDVSEEGGITYRFHF